MIARPIHFSIPTRARIFPRRNAVNQSGRLKTGGIGPKTRIPGLTRPFFRMTWRKYGVNWLSGQDLKGNVNTRRMAVEGRFLFRPYQGPYKRIFQS